MQEVAKSLGAQFNITGIDDAMVAEVAVAAAEKEQDIPLQDDLTTPAVSYRQPKCEEQKSHLLDRRGSSGSALVLRARVVTGWSRAHARHKRLFESRIV